MIYVVARNVFRVILGEISETSPAQGKLDAHRTLVRLGLEDGSATWDPAQEKKK